MNSPSGVNASGPLKSLLTSAVSIAGTRRSSSGAISSNRSQSSGSSCASKPSGTPSSAHGRRVALVAAHDQAADLGAEVDEVVGVAQRRQRLERRVERLGDQVLVRERDDRHVDADHAPDLGRVHAAGVDHDLGPDRALVGDDRVHAAVLELDRRPRACAARSRRRAAARRRPARRSAGSGRGSRRAAGNAAASTPSVDISGNSSCASAGRRRSRSAGRRSSPSRPGAGSPRTGPATTPAAGRRARASRDPCRSLGQLGVEADGVLHHLRQADGRAQLADQAGRVPRRAVGQVVLLDQHDVRPAQLGEVVEDAAAADAAADDNSSGLRAHPPDAATTGIDRSSLANNMGYMIRAVSTDKAGNSASASTGFTFHP